MTDFLLKHQQKVDMMAVMIVITLLHFICETRTVDGAEESKL